MSTLCRFFSSSIGRKVIVGLAGLLLCGFLVAHLAGNLFLFVGEPAFNHYAEFLQHNELLPLAELGLVVLFGLHILVSLKLRYENKQARPVGYESAQSKGGRTPGSRTMIWTALLVLAFVLVHLKTFRFGDDSGPAGLYGLVMTWFANPLYVGFYVVAMIALGLHLSHGIQSAFQTLGVNHPRYTPLIRKLGPAFALIVCGGFAAIPIWAFFVGGPR
jgi:succinate dehydrogenase / fumarate reductase cytochrome b subunit